MGQACVQPQLPGIDLRPINTLEAQVKPEFREAMRLGGTLKYIGSRAKKKAVESTILQTVLRGLMPATSKKATPI